MTATGPLDGVALERALQAALRRRKALAGRLRHGAPATARGMAGPLPTRFAVNPFNIDTALRYAAIIYLVAEVWRPGIDLVEVGSGAGGIAEFLQYPVHGVDPAFDRTQGNTTPYLIRTAGRAEALPYPDAGFDVAICSDTLEHLPEAIRRPALVEMLRVLRPGGRLIATFPSGPAARRCDRILNDAYRARYGCNHPWVVEHLQEGVPDTETMRATLAVLVGPNGRVRMLRHLNERAWLFEQLVYSARRWFAVTLPLGLHSRAGVSLVFRLLKGLDAEPAYRTILVADLPRP